MQLLPLFYKTFVHKKKGKGILLLFVTKTRIFLEKNVHKSYSKYVLLGLIAVSEKKKNMHTSRLFAIDVIIICRGFFLCAYSIQEAIQTAIVFNAETDK